MKTIAPSSFPAKALYVMTICLFECENQVMLRCGLLQGAERWKQLFNLHSGEAAIDGEVPFPM